MITSGTNHEGRRVTLTSVASSDDVITKKCGPIIMGDFDLRRSRWSLRLLNIYLLHANQTPREKSAQKTQEDSMLIPKLIAAYKKVL